MKNRLSCLLVAGAVIISLAGGTAAAAVKPVADAAEQGATAAIRQLLKNGADVNETHGDGMTALHWAAKRGDSELAAMLIVAGAYVNAGTRLGGYTPLHIASRNGHASIVRALLAANADAGAATTNSGVMPLRTIRKRSVPCCLPGQTSMQLRERGVRHR
jgi:ankyrin repeat protein